MDFKDENAVEPFPMKGLRWPPTLFIFTLNGLQKLYFTCILDQILIPYGVINLILIKTGP